MLTSVAVPATYIHRLASSLRQLAASGKVAALPTRTAASGQKVVQVSEREREVRGGRDGRRWERWETVGDGGRGMERREVVIPAST